MKLHTSIMLKDNGQGAGQLSLYGVFEVVFFRVNIWQNQPNFADPTNLGCNSRTIDWYSPELETLVLRIPRSMVISIFA